MGDHEARGDDTERKADKKLSGWGLFGSKYEDAADLYDKAANFFKLSKNCEFTTPPFFPIPSAPVPDRRILLPPISLRSLPFTRGKICRSIWAGSWPATRWG